MIRWIRHFAPLGAIGGLALAVLATTDQARMTLTIPLGPTALGLAPDLLPIATHEAVIRRIARVLRDDLHLPLPERVVLHLYSTPTVFEHDLVAMGVAPRLAADLTSFAAGVTFDQHLLLLEPETRRGARESMRLVAHELTHLSQFELAGGEGRAAQWLSEGMAEWVAYRVLDRLGVRSAREERSAILDAVRAHLRGQELPPPIDLVQLDDPLGFYETGRAVGVVPTYRLAFALTDRLVERHGFDRLLAYFRAFEEVPDRSRNFERAFGLSLQEFQREALDPARLGS